MAYQFPQPPKVGIKPGVRTPVHKPQYQFAKTIELVPVHSEIVTVERTDQASSFGAST